MARILVTGGAGFIGFHVAKALLERGDTVIVVDNFNDYYDPKLKEARAKELTDNYKEVYILRVDIADYGELTKVFEKHKPDKICHLAAQAGVRYSLENPFIYERTNVLGTLNLLELCRHLGPKDFIFASTSSVYGKNTKMPFKETDRTNTQLSLYAATKKSDEAIAHAYHDMFGLNCTGLRFFNVYGPWGRPDLALFLFTQAMLKDEPINVFGYGKSKRDYTYIDDIVDGVLSAIDKPFPYELINLGRGEPVLLLDFIHSLEEYLGKKAKMNLMELQPGEVMETNADISKARKLLGYDPKVSVEEGMKSFLDWYMEYYGD